MKKILFIASLPIKGHSFDGERNKAKAMLSAFSIDKRYEIDVINYSKNKYIETIKLIFKVMFINYDLIYISKCIVGGTIALHQIFLYGKKANKSNIVFYVVGNGYKGFEDKKMFLDDLRKCRKVILESEKVIPQMEKIGVKTDLIFPSIKENFDCPFLDKHYKPDDTLDAIFFSRIHFHKGVMDAIEAVINVNARAGRTLYTLSIAGGKYSEPEYQQTETAIIEEAKKHPEIIYLGTTLNLKNPDSYRDIQKFDLHIFPSRFYQECAPGSVIDMFIAGVPTLSSTFESAKLMMNESNSYFFEIGNVLDLEKQLLHIYYHKEELVAKRREAYKERNKYTIDAYLEFLRKNEII